MHLCNVTSSTTIWYAPLRREKRRSALLESNRPRDIPQGLIKTMAPGGAGHTPAPPPPAHRIDRPLHALKNSFMKMALKDGKYPQNVPFGNISKGDLARYWCCYGVVPFPGTLYSLRQRRAFFVYSQELARHAPTFKGDLLGAGSVSVKEQFAGMIRICNTGAKHSSSPKTRRTGPPLKGVARSAGGCMYWNQLNPKNV